LELVPVVIGNKILGPVPPIEGGPGLLSQLLLGIAPDFYGSVGHRRSKQLISATPAKTNTTQNEISG